MKKKRLTLENLTERWNVPLATLSQWCWDRLGPGYMKLGKHIVHRLQEVEIFEEGKLRRNTTRKG